MNPPPLEPAADPDLARHLRAVTWAAIGMIAAVVLCAPLVSGFRIDWPTFLMPAAATAALAGGAIFYRLSRRDAKLSATLETTAQLVALAAFGAPLSYLAAGMDHPLHDALFTHWDLGLGFDWEAYLRWMLAHPWIHLAFVTAYASFTVQSMAIILVLGFAGHLERLRRFILAFLACVVVTIAVSALYPAAGPWLHNHIDAASTLGYVPVSHSSWPIFFGLRDGSFHLLTGLNSEGIITFPSLRAALAVLFALALWPVRLLRWIAIAVNATMLLATPIEGSHYLVDVIAGVAIALIAWRVVALVAARRPARSSELQLAPGGIAAA